MKAEIFSHDMNVAGQFPEKWDAFEIIENHSEDDHNNA
jgi:hypothetical protein